MPDVDHPRLVLDVEIISTASIEGTDEMMVTLRGGSPDLLKVRMTRSQAGDLMRLISAERARGRAEPAAAPPS